MSWRIRPIDTGSRFGRWTVLSLTSERRNRLCVYLCRCDCGVERGVISQSLKQGTSKSCGCLTADVASIRSHKFFGPKNFPKEYQSWQGMKNRCLNKNFHGWIDYGGRGITMCQSWLNSFENFYTDMGPAPDPSYSIGRTDNDLGYSKENCKWETDLQQSNNKRTNRFITMNGKKLTVSQWSRELDIPRARINSRLRLGWSNHEALKV